MENSEEFIFDIETNIKFQTPESTRIFSLADLKKIQRNMKIDEILGEPKPNMIYFG